MRKVISFPDVFAEEFSLLMKNSAFSVNGGTITLPLWGRTQKDDRDFTHETRSIKVLCDSSSFPNCTKAPVTREQKVFILPSVTNLSIKWLRCWVLGKLTIIFFLIIIIFNYYIKCHILKSYFVETKRDKKENNSCFFFKLIYIWYIAS